MVGKVDGMSLAGFEVDGVYLAGFEVFGLCFAGFEVGWQSCGVAVWLWRFQHRHHSLLLACTHCLPAASQWGLRCGQHPWWKVSFLLLLFSGIYVSFASLVVCLSLSLPLFLSLSLPSLSLSLSSSLSLSLSLSHPLSPTPCPT